MPHAPTQATREAVGQGCAQADTTADWEMLGAEGSTLVEYATVSAPNVSGCWASSSATRDCSADQATGEASNDWEGSRSTASTTEAELVTGAETRAGRDRHSASAALPRGKSASTLLPGVNSRSWGAQGTTRNNVRPTATVNRQRTQSAEVAYQARIAAASTAATLHPATGALLGTHTAEARARSAAAPQHPGHASPVKKRGKASSADGTTVRFAAIAHSTARAPETPAQRSVATSKKARAKRQAESVRPDVNTMWPALRSISCTSRAMSADAGGSGGPPPAESPPASPSANAWRSRAARAAPSRPARASTRSRSALRENSE